MSRTRREIGVALTLAVLWPATLGAQASVPGEGDGGDVLVGAVGAEVGEGAWEAAERLQRDGDREGALRRFQALARAQRENGANPAHTWWRIAEIRFADGRMLAAAQALDAAAAEAARFGDFDLRARALLEAATAYTAGNRHAAARLRLLKLGALVSGPYLSARTRDEIAERVTLP